MRLACEQLVNRLRPALVRQCRGGGEGALTGVCTCSSGNRRGHRRPACVVCVVQEKLQRDEESKAAASESEKVFREFSWEDVVAKANGMSIDLSSQASMRRVGKNKLAYHICGVAASEVEVDVLTGETSVLRTDIVYDCGKSLNPAIDIGQCEVRRRGGCVARRGGGTRGVVHTC